FVCLHHFTNPIWFEQSGAFLRADAIEIFDRYARRVVEALHDLCSDWVTFNEPNVYVALGYHMGEFPPGRKFRLLQAGAVTESLCRCHAATYRLIHKVQPDASVGWAQHYIIMAPENPTSWLDRKMCQIQDRLFNDNFAETILHGRSPFPYSLLGETLREV